MHKGRTLCKTKPLEKGCRPWYLINVFCRVGGQLSPPLFLSVTIFNGLGFRSKDAFASILFHCNGIERTLKQMPSSQFVSRCRNPFSVQLDRTFKNLRDAQSALRPGGLYAMQYRAERCFSTHYDTLETYGTRHSAAWSGARAPLHSIHWCRCR